MIEEIQIKTEGDLTKWTPVQSTEGAAGWDIFSRIDLPLELFPGEVNLVPTGVYMELPPGWACWVIPRSGLAADYGLTIVNSPGLIDSDYRGEIKVILCVIKTSEKSDWGYTKSNQRGITIQPYSRIAQLVPFKVDECKLIHTTRELNKTKRGEKGLGSTGT